MNVIEDEGRAKRQGLLRHEHDVLAGEGAEAEVRDLGGAVGLEDNARPSPIRGLFPRGAAEDMTVLERCWVLGGYLEAVISSMRP